MSHLGTGSDDRRDAEYGIITASDVMVGMRDGTRLATDIHYSGSRSPGRWPSSPK